LLTVGCKFKLEDGDAGPDDEGEKAKKLSGFVLELLGTGPSVAEDRFLTHPKVRAVSCVPSEKICVIKDMIF